MPTHSIQVEEQRPDDQPAQGIAQAGANGTGLGFPELGSSVATATGGQRPFQATIPDPEHRTAL